MKKLLLSSIIMLGICGIATAQTARDSKAKLAPASTTSATATPQKAAWATNENVVIVNADGTTAATNDVTAPDTKVAQSDKKAALQVSQTDADIAKKKEMEAAKTAAPATKKDN